MTSAVFVTNGNHDVAYIPVSSQQIANAILIHAAPDMLSALRLGLDFIIEQRNAGLDVDHEFDILSAAIQQATHP